MTLAKALFVFASLASLSNIGFSSAISGREWRSFRVDNTINPLANVGDRLQKRDPASTFGYGNEKNPSTWGKEHPTCGSGKEQSPVNFSGTKRLRPKTEGPVVHWGTYSNVSVEHLNTTIEALLSKAATGTSNLTFPGNSDVYVLQQFHFHVPSEHHIHGKVFPLEAHFVFKTKEGKVAVIGFLFDFSTESNPFLTSVFPSVPVTEGESVELETLSLAPIAQHYEASTQLYRYGGSLTTPPCTEGVRWTVVPEPMKMNVNQTSTLWKAIPFNARFTQPNLE